MIIGKQIRFRAIEKDDLQYFVKWLNDPEVRQGLFMIMPLSLAEEENWFEELLKKPQYEKPLALEIQPDPQVDEWIFVGNCGLFGIDWQNRYAEIGIHIGEKGYWNQGFGTKAIRLITSTCTGSGCESLKTTPGRSDLTKKPVLPMKESSVRPNTLMENIWML